MVEEVARVDSAAGWNLQLSVAAHFLLAWLPEEGAAEILAGNGKLPRHIARPKARRSQWKAAIV